MKNIKIFAIFIVAIMAYSCDKSYDEPSQLSDAEWVTSQQTADTMFQVALDGYISFIDLSQGTLSHKWTIDSGCSFLSSNFSKADSVYTDFILPDAGLISSDPSVHVLFSEAGMKKINLYNTFSDSVSYKRNDGSYLSSVRKGDLWVIDTTFVVDVFDVINPSVNIYQDGTLVASVSENENPLLENQASWDTIYVEAGASLSYVDMTTQGRPNKRVWTADGGAFVGNATDSAAVVKYFSLGNYTSSILSSRIGTVPLGQTSKLIPMIVKVIPSSQPFVVVDGSFQENEDESISFNVSGEIAPITGEIGNFTVHVENVTAGFSKDIAVTSVKKNSSDATKIDLKLAEYIYNTDVITVSYAGGNIKSVDFRTLNAFAASLPVEMSLGSSLLDSDWAGFETVNTNIRNAFCVGYWAAKTNDDGTFQRTDEKAASGSASMRFASVDGFAIKRTLQGSNFTTGISIPEGKYLVSMKIFLDQANTMTTISTFIQTPGQTLTWDLTTVERGEWVTLKQEVTTLEVSGRYDLIVDPLDNPGVTTDQKFYIDDYVFVPLELRP